VNRRKAVIIGAVTVLIAIGLYLLPQAGPQAVVWDNAKWNDWVKLYQSSFPADKRFTSPSLTGTAYYNDFNAVFTVLNKINGDLSDGHKKFREEMAKLGLTMGVFVATADFDKPTFALSDQTDIREKILADIRDSIEVAKRVNAKWCTVVPGRYDLKLHRDYQTANLIDLFRSSNTAKRLKKHWKRQGEPKTVWR